MTTDRETNRKKFSNWLQGVNSLNVTKTALHDHVLETWKERLMSWDKCERDHIPSFLKCVASDKIKVIKCNNNINKKEKGADKRKWDCVCEHATCKTILEKILDLQQNPGFNIIWNSYICENLSNVDGQLEEEDGTENIPRVETSSAWTLVYEWVVSKIIPKTHRKVRYKDIFDDCKQKHIWCIANMFMQRGKAKTNIANTGPQDTDPSMFFKMMKNCKLFEIENENYIYDTVILCRDKLHHSPSNRLRQQEAKTHLNSMIELLKKFEDVSKCKEAIQDIEKMLQETVMSLSVKNDNINELARQALEMKKSALEVDTKIDTTVGFKSDDTEGLLEDTAKDLDRISDSQSAVPIYDGMKSREDYKHEHGKIDEIQQKLKKVEKENETLKHHKRTTTGQSESSQFSATKDEQAKEHVAKMVNILTTAESDPKLYGIITEQLIPVIDQVTADASDINENIKENVNEVRALEKTNQKSTEDKQNSCDETEGLQGQDGNGEDSSHDTDGNGQLWTIQYLDGSSSILQPAQHYNIRQDGESTGNSFLTCCRISSAEILLADRKKKKLKKLDDKYRIISSLDLCEWPFDICYADNNECVVALLGKKLQFVDVRDDIELTRSHKTNHDCSGLTYHDNQLYVVDNKTVYIYSKDGIMQHVLYTHKLNETVFRHIALNDDTGRIYITCFNNGLVTIDTSGNYISTFSDPELGHASGVCVDGGGNVLVCGSKSSNILQICPEGRQKLGIIENKSGGEGDMTALYFDKQNDVLITAGQSGNLTVLKMK